MGRVGSYPTFSPLPRRFSRMNFPIAASGNRHTMRGISSPHGTRLRWASMGPVFTGEAVYFCCTCPEVTLGGRYPLSLALWSPDFPHPGPFGLRPRLSDLVAQLLYRKSCPMSNILQNLLEEDIL